MPDGVPPILAALSQTTEPPTSPGRFTVRRYQADQEAQRAALAPWAEPLRQMRFDATASLEDPHVLAQRATRLARQMSQAARTLREYARAIMAEEGQQ